MHKKRDTCKHLSKVRGDTYEWIYCMLTIRGSTCIIFILWGSTLESISPIKRGTFACVHSEKGFFWFCVQIKGAPGLQPPTDWASMAVRRKQFSSHLALNRLSEVATVAHISMFVCMYVQLSRHMFFSSIFVSVKYDNNIVNKSCYLRCILLSLLLVYSACGEYTGYCF